MNGSSNPVYFLIWLIDKALSAYSLLIILRALLSWFSPNPYNRLYIFLIRITEPVLAPLRRIIPLQGIDFSPVIAILLIDLVFKRIVLYFISSVLIP